MLATTCAATASLSSSDQDGEGLQRVEQIVDDGNVQPEEPIARLRGEERQQQLHQRGGIDRGRQAAEHRVDLLDLLRGHRHTGRWGRFALGWRRRWRRGGGRTGDAVDTSEAQVEQLLDGPRRVDRLLQQRLQLPVDQRGHLTEAPGNRRHHGCDV